MEIVNFLFIYHYKNGYRVSLASFLIGPLQIQWLPLGWKVDASIFEFLKFGTLNVKLGMLERSQYFTFV
ncbi:hypothetical protein GDO81_022008 [Engystomops pustulosus]|uniref:Uncharacterized protein n=1 Tax=Engystomops pustulosus TaxID=76066 RepID=A0AAV6YUF3_ENGPU|nr:hypothetical protein GDO81_022008 [Engystomops pustulosus]